MGAEWPRLNAFCKWEYEPRPMHYNGQSGPAPSGHIYYYVEFDGDSSYINCGSDTSLDNLHANSFTVDGWILSHDIIGARTIIRKNAVFSSGGWEILLNAATLQAYMGYTIRAQARSVQAITAATWAHFTMAFDKAGTKKIYFALNGAWCTYSLQSAYNLALVSDAAAPLIIGTSAAGWWFDGGIAWARISSGFRYPIGINFTPPDRCAPPAVDATTVELWAMDEGAGAAAGASVVAANQGAMTDCDWHLCL